MSFASRSVTRHLVRGLVGLVAVAAAVAGTALVTPAALALLLVAAVAWRGCPTCWAVGLAQTRAREACACARPARGRQSTTA